MVDAPSNHAPAAPRTSAARGAELDVRVFRRLLARSVVLPIVLALALAGALIWQIASLLHTVTAVDRCDRVMAQINYDERLMIDGETGLRGFLLTRDTDFLQPYARATAQLPRELARFDQLIATDASERPLSDRLNQEYSQWFRVAQIREHSSADEVLAQSRTARQGMDAMRATSARLLADESARRDALRDRSNAQTRTVFLLTFGLSVLTAVVLVWFSRRQLVVLSQTYAQTLDRANRSADELAQAADSLRRDAEFRELVIGIVGHDLRSPLSSIALGVGSLLQQVRLDEPQRSVVSRIGSSAARMERMIRDLLDYTRTRHGEGIPIQAKATDLRAICKHVVDEAQLANQDQTVRLVADGDCRGAWDEDRLAQMVANVLGNAMKFAEPGSAVDLAVVCDPTRATLRVTNKGPVIPVDMHEAIFEPFRRGSMPDRLRRETGIRRGLGLGLFIARQIAGAHGGTIRVESSGADGTTFEVQLPRSAPLAIAESRDSAVVSESSPQA